MGKKSNKKNKPSKAEKRLKKQRYNDLSFSEKHLDEMKEHFERLVSEFWAYFTAITKQDDPEALIDKEKELTYFDGLVNLAEEAWNMAVTCDSLDDACDAAYDTHDANAAEIITGMIKYKMEQFPQDKVLIRNSETQREEDGELSFSFDFDYTVMDDELDELEAKKDDFSWEDLLDQDAIDKALEGIPPEFQRAAYEHEVNRQLNEMKKRFDDLLKDEKDDEASSAP